MTNLTLTWVQQERLDRVKALTNAERENVLRLLAVSAGRILDAVLNTVTESQDPEAAAREDERRKCAEEIRADVKRMDGQLMPLIIAATLDAADVIDPDVKRKAKWAAEK